MTAARRLTFADVSFGYPDRPVFDRLSLTVEPGAFVGLIGPNGSGKSTLVGLVSGAIAPDTGTVDYGGIDVTRDRAAAARRIAFVPQATVVQFPYRGAEFVAMGRYPYQQGIGFDTPLDRAAVTEAMETTDTARFADRFLHELSGGERQRLLLARALAQDPDLLLLDEPTSHLDLGNQARFLEVLEALRRSRPRTVVFVTHDVNLIASRVDRLLLLDRGRVVADGRPADVVTAANLAPLFGSALRFVPDATTGVPLVFPTGRPPPSRPSCPS